MTRKGYTLVELMVTVIILSIVACALGGPFIAINRMIKTSFTEAELSIRSRELRERLLYCCEQPHDNKSFSGLLSGKPVAGAISDSEIRMTSEVFDADTGVNGNHTIRLAVKTSNEVEHGWFENSSDTVEGRSKKWLRPGGISYLDGDNAINTDQLANNLLFVNIRSTLNGMTRNERIVVPIFGTEQIKNISNVFHD